MGRPAAATAYTADMDALFSPEMVTVLMVDDDAELAAMVTELLQAQGMQVHSAGTAAQGLAALTQKPTTAPVPAVMPLTVTRRSASRLSSTSVWPSRGTASGACRAFKPSTSCGSRSTRPHEVITCRACDVVINQAITT